MLCVVLLWVIALPRQHMMIIVRWYYRTLCWLERVCLGLHYEIRGWENIPQGPSIIAAKHQSAWETMKIPLLFPDATVILKKELLRIPLWGWYVTKAEMIPINREATIEALRFLIKQGRKYVSQGRSIVIFPQGTRTAIGEYSPYHVGVGMLYETLHIPIVPMALNSGLFWPRNWLDLRSGTITISFLPMILPGQGRRDVMKLLEEQLEKESDHLIVEARQTLKDSRG